MNARVWGVAAGLATGLVSSAAIAADIINQDNKAYKVTVQGEGKLSTSSYNVKARGSQYGACNYSWCTFAIPGSKVSADRNGKVFIRNGKLVKG
jgi:hypothetical protein